MIASNVSREMLESAAQEIGVRADIETKNMAGTRHRVKLYPDAWQDPEHALTPAGRRRRGEQGNRKYQRTSAGYNDTRRVHAVCWHGFRDYFRAVFSRMPQAVFATAYDTWRGSEDFEARYRQSGHRNVGSQMYPRTAAEVCSCPDSGMAV